MTYWDTSCLIKLYVAEPDSDAWQDRVAAEASPCLSSGLLYAELAFALQQKELRQEIHAGSARRLFEHFKRHVQQGRFELLPVGTDVLEQSAVVALRCYSAKPVVPLRTADGIHLATAMILGCSRVASTDQRLLSALPILGLESLTPER